jgi:hypothetical protein
MCALFRKATSIERRRRKIERAMALIDDDIKALSKAVDDPVHAENIKLKSSDVMPSSGEKGEAQRKPEAGNQTSGNHEERFSEYLSGDFQTIGSLKNERKLQRNKAVVMIVFVIFLVLWLWRYLF